VVKKDYYGLWLFIYIHTYVDQRSAHITKLFWFPFVCVAAETKQNYSLYLLNGRLPTADQHCSCAIRNVPFSAKRFLQIPNSFCFMCLKRSRLRKKKLFCMHLNTMLQRFIFLNNTEQRKKKFRLLCVLWGKWQIFKHIFRLLFSDVRPTLQCHTSTGRVLNNIT